MFQLCECSRLRTCHLLVRDPLVRDAPVKGGSLAPAARGQPKAGSGALPARGLLRHGAHRDNGAARAARPWRCSWAATICSRCSMIHCRTSTDGGVAVLPAILFTLASTSAAAQSSCVPSCRPAASVASSSPAIVRRGLATSKAIVMQSQRTHKSPIGEVDPRHTRGRGRAAVPGPGHRAPGPFEFLTPCRRVGNDALPWRRGGARRHGVLG